MVGYQSNEAGQAAAFREIVSAQQVQSYGVLVWHSTGNQHPNLTWGIAL
jgi:hypothetical protein